MIVWYVEMMMGGVLLEGAEWWRHLQSYFSDMTGRGWQTALWWHLKVSKSFITQNTILTSFSWLLEAITYRYSSEFTLFKHRIILHHPTSSSARTVVLYSTEWNAASSVRRISHHSWYDDEMLILTSTLQRSTMTVTYMLSVSANRRQSQTHIS